MAAKGPCVTHRSTIHSVQLLRSVAASLVVLFHTHQAFAARVSSPLFADESYLFAFGAVGVHVFFVISGFIMVATSFRGAAPFRVNLFLKRRLLRIYPIYWLCAAGYLLVHVIIGLPYGLSARDVIGALVLWPVDAPKIIGPAWTLAYEMFFYICFGLAMTIGLNRGLIALSGSFFILIAAGTLISGKGIALGLITNPLLLEFLAGSAIGWLAHNGLLPRRHGIVIAVIALGLFALGIAAGYDRVPNVVAWGVPSALLVLGLVSWESGRKLPPFWQVVARLGDSSYVLYLIHILLITLAIVVVLATPLALRPAPAVAAAIVALMAIGIAAFVHHRIEVPMLRQLQRMLIGKTDVAGSLPPVDHSSIDAR